MGSALKMGLFSHADLQALALDACFRVVDGLQQVIEPICLYTGTRP